jgi:hypothetical protein
MKTSEVRAGLALNRALAKQQIRRNDATIHNQWTPSTTHTVNEARAYDPSGPRVAVLRCRVVGVEGTYRAPNLLKRDGSDRLGNLQPKAFTLILEGGFTADDHDAMRALAELSRTGGSVTVRVEVGE